MERERDDTAILPIDGLVVLTLSGPPSGYSISYLASTGGSQLRVFGDDELCNQDHVQADADEHRWNGAQKKVHHQPRSDGHNLRTRHADVPNDHTR